MQDSCLVFMFKNIIFKWRQSVHNSTYKALQFCEESNVAGFLIIKVLRNHYLLMIDMFAFNFH